MNNSLKPSRTGRAVKATPMPDLSNRFSLDQLGKAITAKRTGMTLSLMDVSGALGISKPTLLKIEKGDSRVHLDNVLKVMEYLGLSFRIVSDDSLGSVDEGDHDAWY